MLIECILKKRGSKGEKREEGTGEEWKRREGKGGEGRRRG